MKRNNLALQSTAQEDENQIRLKRSRITFEHLLLKLKVRKQQ